MGNDKSCLKTEKCAKAEKEHGSHVTVAQDIFV